MNKRFTISMALCLAMFATGASGIIGEYILATVSTYILGNSVEQFSIVIATMLLCMGVAAIIQTHFKDELVTEAFLTIEAALAILVTVAPILLLTAFVSVPERFEFFQYLIVGLIGLCIGFEIPLVIRINDSNMAALDKNLKNVFMWDYVGAFVGALVWAHYFLANYTLTKIAAMVGGLNLCVALLVFGMLFTKMAVWKRIAFGTLYAACAFTIAVFYIYGDDTALTIERKLFEDHVEASHLTRYQKLDLTRDLDSPTSNRSLFINGKKQFATDDEFIYHENLVHPAMALAPRHDNVLILGGGDGMALREVLKWKDVKNALLVDLDPEMIRLFKEVEPWASLNDHAFENAKVHASVSSAVSFFGRADLYVDNNYREGAPDVLVPDVGIYNIDAASFLRDKDVRSTKWDVVIIDFPDPSSIELVKLYSTDFYSSLRSITDDDTVIVIQSTSPFHSREAYLCIGRTAKSVGWHVTHYHDNVPSFGEWGWTILTKKPLDTTIKSFPAEVDKELKYLTTDLWEAGLKFGRGVLRSSNTDVNTIMNPCLLRYYNVEGWKDE